MKKNKLQELQNKYNFKLNYIKNIKNFKDEIIKKKNSSISN